jgi:hypothetical protein|tara:strand:- start:134 stop:385 length:252 start_codon:yes stop_codon:yes gene_type:complete
VSYVDSKTGKRDYTKERLRESAEAKIKRKRRGVARYAMQLKVGDPRVVDHIDNNALNNSKSNLRIVSKQVNQQKQNMRKKRNG